MEQTIASELVTEYLAFCDALDRITVSIAKLPDAEQQKQLRRAVAEAHNHLYSELLCPILREHPCLDPDLPRSSTV